MFRRSVALAMVVVTLQPVLAAQTHLPLSDEAEQFPITTARGDPLPQNAIVICSDRPDWALTSVSKLIRQRFSDADFSIADGRQGPILTGATLAYFGHQFSVRDDDVCLDRYPTLKAAVAKKLAQPAFMTGQQLCGQTCPPGIGLTQQYPTSMTLAYSYTGSPSRMDTYVAFCSVEDCEIDILLGLFQLERLMLP